MKFGPTMQKILLSGFSLTKIVLYVLSTIYVIFKKTTEYQVTDEAAFSTEMSCMEDVISKCYHIFHVTFISKCNVF